MIPREHLQVCSKIRCLIMDSDGVLTDNTEITGFPDQARHVLKRRSHYDGQGISFLRAMGIRIVVITGEKGKSANFIRQLVKKWNDLPSVRSGFWAEIDLFLGKMGEQKVDVLEIWTRENNIKFSECAAMGDDLTDLPMLQKVAFSVAPASAEEYIKNYVDYVTVRPGGGGAIRDLANLIMKSNNVDPASLSLC